MDSTAEFAQLRCGGEISSSGAMHIPADSYEITDSSRRTTPVQVLPFLRNVRQPYEI